jgi:hypothetical protein
MKVLSGANLLESGTLELEMQVLTSFYLLGFMFSFRLIGFEFGWGFNVAILGRFLVSLKVLTDFDAFRF